MTMTMILMMMCLMRMNLDQLVYLQMYLYVLYQNSLQNCKNEYAANKYHSYSISNGTGEMTSELSSSRTGTCISPYMLIIRHLQLTTCIVVIDISCSLKCILFNSFNFLSWICRCNCKPHKCTHDSIVVRPINGAIYIVIS